VAAMSRMNFTIANSFGNSTAKLDFTDVGWSINSCLFPICHAARRRQ